MGDAYFNLNLNYGPAKVGEGKGEQLNQRWNRVQIDTDTSSESPSLFTMFSSFIQERKALIAISCGSHYKNGFLAVTGTRSSYNLK